jgi:hypothetical protein
MALLPSDVDGVGVADLRALASAELLQPVLDDARRPSAGPVAAFLRTSKIDLRRDVSRAVVFGWAPAATAAKDPVWAVAVEGSFEEGPVNRALKEAIPGGTAEYLGKRVLVVDAPRAHAACVVDERLLLFGAREAVVRALATCDGRSAAVRADSPLFRQAAQVRHKLFWMSARMSAKHVQQATDGVTSIVCGADLSDARVSLSAQIGCVDGTVSGKLKATLDAMMPMLVGTKAKVSVDVRGTTVHIDASFGEELVKRLGP